MHTNVVHARIKIFFNARALTTKQQLNCIRATTSEVAHAL